MSEAIRLVVVDPVMVKRSDKNGKPWELWKFKAQCPDGRTHTIRTFWSSIDRYAGKEVFGTITEEEKTLPADGTPYTSRTFQVDAAWDMAQKTAGHTPIQATLHPGLKTGSQVLAQQQQSNNCSAPRAANEKLAIVLKAYEVAASLSHPTTAADADLSLLALADLAGKIVKEIYAEYRTPTPEQFAPNTTPQQRSTAPAQRAAAAQKRIEEEMGAEEVDA